ncbi:hypothetical protein HHI36_016597 [Cryptolaemus montrouzieri]|uniref:Uncharacterized protein n=1 Tax=Cryptolaemus montrouzieri TaxID=559131 RepID=A0ABD2NK55_9CUCU
MEEYWYRYEYRYEKKILFLYVTCKDMTKDCDISANVCPNNNCKYISFHDSKIESLRSNLFISINSVEEIFLNSTGVDVIQISAFSGLSKLEKLHLEDNKISNIYRGTFNSLYSLKFLDLHENEIDFIESGSFMGLGSLENIDLSYNKIRNISYDLIEPLKKLDKLILTNNFLTSVDFTIPKGLKTLYLDHNNIEKLDNCINKSNTTKLLPQSNIISQLHQSCFPQSLHNLHLNGNNISELNELTFMTLKELIVLNISANHIKDAPIKLFGNLENLEYLDLSQNEIYSLRTGIFSRLQALKFLNLSHTKIKEVDIHTFIPLVSLETLDISFDDLEMLDPDIFDHYVNFKEIYLQSNNFSCNAIVSIISKSRANNFSLIYNQVYSTQNIKGLPCKKNRILQSLPENANLNEDDTKYVGNFSAEWKIEKEEMLENISNILDENMESLKRILLEYRKLLEDIHSNDIREQKQSVLDNKLMFNKLLESLRYSKEHENETTSVYPSDYLEGISKIQFQHEFDMKNSSEAISFQIEKLRDSVYHLNIIVITACMVYVFIYSLKMCCGYIRKRRKETEMSHELPILRNY